MLTKARARATGSRVVVTVPAALAVESVTASLGSTPEAFAAAGPWARQEVAQHAKATRKAADGKVTCAFVMARLCEHGSGTERQQACQHESDVHSRHACTHSIQRLPPDSRLYLAQKRRGEPA
jgi:hypothetical protein